MPKEISEISASSWFYYKEICFCSSVKLKRFVLELLLSLEMTVLLLLLLGVRKCATKHYLRQIFYFQLKHKLKLVTGVFRHETLREIIQELYTFLMV